MIGTNVGSSWLRQQMGESGEIRKPLAEMKLHF